MLKEKLLKEGIILGKELTLEDIREMDEEEVFVEFVDKQGWVGGNPIDDIHKIITMDRYLFKVVLAIGRSGKGFAIDTLIGNGVKAYKFERTKFKVGDKVVLASGRRWGADTKYRIVTDVIKSSPSAIKGSYGISYKLSSYELVKNNLEWVDSELELYTEPKVEDTTDTGELSEDAKLRKRISKLTTENISLRQENKKLKDLLDEKDEELDKVLKDLKEVIDTGDELVENVEKLIEFLPKIL